MTVLHSTLSVWGCKIGWEIRGYKIGFSYSSKVGHYAIAGGWTSLTHDRIGFWMGKKYICSTREGMGRYHPRVGEIVENQLNSTRPRAASEEEPNHFLTSSLLRFLRFDTWEALPAADMPHQQMGRLLTGGSKLGSCARATSAVVMTTSFAVHFRKTGSGRSAWKRRN